MKNFGKLEKKLNINFTNQDLLTTSMVHRSYINEHPSFKLDHNERLEFLGDAVLELVVTKHLYLNYKNPEGELTNWRASLVNSTMLAKIAEKLELNEFLYLSKGEAKDDNTKARQYILANAFEALIGAIYLDQGLETADKFIKEHILSELEAILQNHLYLDPKSKFQEAAQEKFGITPSYKVISETGPDHNKKFIVGVHLDKKLIAKGEGTSKHEAQVAAAEAGLEQKGW
ncbi:ribonuclease III [Patescibacteria group bacterium]|nr:ribonuclease III [Patescibacteria group bacterium]MBU0963806.1 ribonuclease III [Patescibacteria group bacterium]